jgi:hypothetical protein
VLLGPTLLIEASSGFLATFAPFNALVKVPSHAVIAYDFSTVYMLMQFGLLNDVLKNELLGIINSNPRSFKGRT